jgi:hypothetical protein
LVESISSCLPTRPYGTSGHCNPVRADDISRAAVVAFALPWGRWLTAMLLMPEGTDMLTEKEICTYREEGLVIPRYQLPAEVFGKLREDCERLIRDNPEVRPEKLMNAHLEKLPGRDEGLRGGGRILCYATRSDILDLVAQLIGPDIVLWGSQMFAKPGGDGMEVPWHQDGHYWPIRPLAAITVWIAIDDSTAENGCMRYIPGSHKSGVLSHYLDERRDLALSRSIQKDLFDEAKAKDHSLLAGQMSLHDVFLIHGSNANRSSKRRAGLTFRYMPATSHFDRSFGSRTEEGFVDFSRRPIFLVRGVNRHPGNDFQVGHL